MADTAQKKVPPQKGAKGKGKGKKGEGPKLKLPEIKLPSIKMPAVDPGLVLAAGALTFLSVASSVFAVKAFFPARLVVQEGQTDPLPVVKGPGIAANPSTSLSPTVAYPTIAVTAFVHPQATVIGPVTLSEGVYVGPQAAIQGTGSGVYLGPGDAVLDGAVVEGAPSPQASVQVEGKSYALFVAARAVLAPQSQVLGPSAIGEGAFLASGAMAIRSQLGRGVVLEPRATVIGVTVAPGRYVPAGTTVATQQAADALPIQPVHYAYAQLANDLRTSADELARAYLAAGPDPTPTPPPPTETIIQQGSGQD